RASTSRSRREERRRRAPSRGERLGLQASFHHGRALLEWMGSRGHPEYVGERKRDRGHDEVAGCYRPGRPEVAAGPGTGERTGMDEAEEAQHRTRGCVDRRLDELSV